MNHAERFKVTVTTEPYRHMCEYKFDWTEDRLSGEVGALAIGQRSWLLGKATDAEYSDATRKIRLTYRKENTDGNNYVRLTFSKDGVYVLICLSNFRL